MNRLFSKKNKVAPAVNAAAPNAKKQNYVRDDTPDVSSGSDNSSSLAGLIDDTYKENFFLVIPNQDVMQGNTLLKVLDSGILSESLHIDKELAFNFAKKNDPSGHFTIHEFSIPISRLHIEENTKHEEVCKFDALEDWTSATSYSPKDSVQSGKSVPGNKIHFYCYVVIPGTITELLNSSGAIKSAFPATYATAEQAFTESRKLYPLHALTLMELKIQLPQKYILHENFVDVLSFIKSNTTSILSYTQSNKNFTDGKLLDVKSMINSDDAHKPALHYPPKPSRK